MLPNSPFAKERYWIDIAADGQVAAPGMTTSVLHPLAAHEHFGSTPAELQLHL
jgi:hypothetical protein